jgi:hypothetical protein
MLALNAAGTHYTNHGLPDHALVVPADAPLERAGKPHEDDTAEYFVVHIRKEDQENPDTKPGRYLVDARGQPKYRSDLPIQRESELMDNGQKPPKGFSAPQPQLFSTIIQGILGGKLEWGLVILGVLIAVTMELAGVPALPFAVGMYIPLSSTTPIFIGGLVRWLSDKARGVSASESESETSPGVLLSSGYIAGGTLCGLIIAFFAFLPDAFNNALNLTRSLGEDWAEKADNAKLLALATFVLLTVILLVVGSRKNRIEDTGEDSG